jgi:hypothetical protein
MAFGWWFGGFSRISVLKLKIRVNAGCKVKALFPITHLLDY